MALRDIKNILIAAFFLSAIAYYFVTPITADVYVFLGSARLADIQYGGGIWGAMQSWELKPFANRIFIYGLYRGALLLGDFSNKEIFALNLKIVYFLFVLVIGLAGNRLFKQYLKQEPDLPSPPAWQSYLMISGMMLVTSYKCIMQSEFNALLFSVLALMLIITEKWYWLFLGGLVLSAVPFFKGVSAIFSIQVLLIGGGVYSLSRKNTASLTVLFVLLVLMIMALLKGFYHQELVDILDATAFQSTFKVPADAWIRSLFLAGAQGLFVGSLHHPFLLLSILGLVGLALGRSRPHGILPIALAWLTGYFAVGIQNRYIGYHYVMLYLPMLYSLLFMYVWWRKAKYAGLSAQYLVALMLVVLPFGLFLVNTSPLQTAVPRDAWLVEWSTSYLATKERENKLREFSRALKIRNDKNDSKALYLDDGTRLWLVDMKSASRYYYPLPVQRALANHDLMKRKCFEEVAEAINGYDGEYILWNEDWFVLPEWPLFEPFRKKLTDYYKMKISDNVYLYTKRVGLKSDAQLPGGNK